MPNLPPDPSDYILDLSSSPKSGEEPAPRTPKTAIPYLSIFFRCCNIYAPIYRNASATAYTGHCPRCLRPAKIPIGPNGSTSRIFEAT